MQPINDDNDALNIQRILYCCKFLAETVYSFHDSILKGIPINMLTAVLFIQTCTVTTVQQHKQLNENVAYKRTGALPKQMADPEIIMVKAIVSALATCMLYIHWP